MTSITHFYLRFKGTPQNFILANTISCSSEGVLPLNGLVLPAWLTHQYPTHPPAASEEWPDMPSLKKACVLSHVKLIKVNS